MDEENEKKQKIAELISAIKKAKGIDSESMEKSIRAADIWLYLREQENIKSLSKNDYAGLKFQVLDYLYERGLDDAAGYENSFKKQENRFNQLNENTKNIIEKFAGSNTKIEIDDEFLAIKIAGTMNNSLFAAKSDFQKQVENRKYLRKIMNIPSQKEIIDNGIESLQENGGISEAAMEADYEAEQNPRPDYLDENGNAHWFDEEENIVAENEREYQKAEDFSARMFTYNDFNFVAVRKFSEAEKTFVDSVVSNEQNKKLLSKNALYYAGYLERQKPVSEQKFEKALKVFNKADFLQTSNSDADIFYCREKGTFYTALNNDFLVPLEFVYSSDRQEKDVFENRFLMK